MATSLRPQVITLEILEQCNRACHYCYNHATVAGEARSAAPPLSTDALLDALRTLVTATGAGTVQVAGGEPLLHPDLVHIIRTVTSWGCRCTLLTDGGLIDAQVALKLKGAGISLVQPTLLAGHRSAHDAIKGGAAFDATIAGIEHLLEAKIPVAVAFVATAENCDAFKEVVELCFALGIRSVAFSRYTSSGDRRRDESLVPSHQQVRRALQTADWANRVLGMKVVVAIAVPHCLASGLSLPALPLGGCSLGGETPGLTLDCRGNLRACAVSGELLGNLTEGAITALLTMALPQYLERRRALPPQCMACAHAPRCHGGCRESAHKRGGPRSMDPLVPAQQSPMG